MGHKKIHVSQGCRRALWVPQQDFLKSTFSIDFYALSDDICCQKQITGDIVKIAIFKMAAKISLQFLTHHLKAQNPIRMPNVDKKSFLMPHQLICHSY